MPSRSISNTSGNIREKQYHSPTAGFSLIETMTALALGSLMMGIAVFNFRALENPAHNGASALVGFIKQARAKALSGTMPYSVKATSSRHIVATFGSSCTATTQTVDTALTLDLPNGAYLTDTTWSVCFSTRGLADTSVDIEVRDGSESRTVEVVLGGAARVS